MLAAHIEMRPYSAIYRRFTALNAQNVLHLQAELTNLEQQLHKQQTADSNDVEVSPNTQLVGTGYKFLKRMEIASSWTWL